MSAPTSSNELIEQELRQRLGTVEQLLGADVITYAGPISDETPGMFKGVIEQRDPKRDKLAILLETEGGYVEDAERIVNILRHHYQTVDFLVTSYAMSAGTVLVMSGDSIYMDYSAMLGPIDPQIQRFGSNTFVPALGYLEQYDRLVRRSSEGVLTTAELAYLIEKFDPAEMYRYEQARDLSIALLEEWLVRYKFKNWKVTETRGRSVSPSKRRSRAVEIARQLNETSRWHSHSRGISIEVARRELKLLIEDIADTPDLQEALRNYTRLLLDYRARRGHYSFTMNWMEDYHGH